MLVEVKSLTWVLRVSPESYHTRENSEHITDLPISLKSKQIYFLENQAT